MDGLLPGPQRPHSEFINPQGKEWSCAPSLLCRLFKLCSCRGNQGATALPIREEEESKEVFAASIYFLCDREVQEIAETPSEDVCIPGRGDCFSNIQERISYAPMVVSQYRW